MNAESQKIDGRERMLRLKKIKGGDPAAGSPTATL